LVPYAERCTYLYSPPRQQFLEPLMKNARERFGASTVPTNRRGLGELLKRLKNGEITGILPDQVPDEGNGVISQFYGRKAYTMTLIHGLIQRTDCSVVSGVALRAKGGFHIHISPVDSALYSSNADESLLGLNRSVENCIQMAPEQYQWEYKRFKKTGEKGIYR
ncbi:MAG: lysophospholipid acyltransferase family protein, partial [Cellvibrionaceae bacterium]|nr:lysophospholipid acyltransferase family protein [Cellvibrionaceae bacterium]